MPDPDREIDIRVVPLVGWSAAAVDGMVTAVAIVQGALDVESIPGGVDAVAALDPDATSFLAANRLLAREVVDVLASADATRTANEASIQALGSITSLLDTAHVRIDDARREAALATVATLIREAGLEYHDLDCKLGTDQQTGSLVVAAFPVKPATAHVWLLESLFARLDAFILRDDDLVRERAASAWYFSRWSVTKKGKLADSGAFAREVREQEWSIVYRDTLTLGIPVLSAFISDEGFADVPPRQQRIARALERSFTDVFEIESVRDDRVTLHRVRGGRRYEVHEHHPSGAIAPGLILVGRLIPFDDHLWLRSPGTLAFPPRSDDDASILARSLDLAEESGVLPEPIAIEGILSVVLFDAKPPSNHPPASSATEARTILDEANEWLDDLGLRTEVRREDAPVELQKQMASSDVIFYEMEVDVTVQEWMSALFSQASRVVPNKSSAARQATKKSKKPGKKRRR